MCILCFKLYNWIKYIRDTILISTCRNILNSRGRQKGNVKGNKHGPMPHIPVFSPRKCYIPRRFLLYLQALCRNIQVVGFHVSFPGMKNKHEGNKLEIFLYLNFDLFLKVKQFVQSVQPYLGYYKQLIVQLIAQKFDDQCISRFPTND